MMYTQVLTNLLTHLLIGDNGDNKQNRGTVDSSKSISAASASFN